MSTANRSLNVTKYLKTQPVEIKYIVHCIRILKILFDGNKAKNQVFNVLRKDELRIPYQNDKSKTLEMIKLLQKNELIKVINNNPPLTKIKLKSRKKNQKHILELTPLGRDLSQLVNSLDEYDYSYKNLNTKVDARTVDNTGSINRLTLLHKLRNKGWTSQDLDNYSKIVEMISSLESHFLPLTLDTLLSRYFTILHKHNPLNNVAKEILRHVVMNSITQFVLDRLEGSLVDRLYSNKSARDIAYEDTHLLLSGWGVAIISDLVSEYSKIGFLKDESLDLAKKLYHFLNPENGLLHKVIHERMKTNPELDKFIQELEKSSHT
jgi:hypothetical protein